MPTIAGKYNVRFRRKKRVKSGTTVTWVDDVELWGSIDRFNQTIRIRNYPTLLTLDKLEVLGTNEVYHITKIIRGDNEWSCSYNGG